MTLEEKIEHLQASAMKDARAEGNDIIDTYRSALQKVLDDHKKEALAQSETRVKAESVNARQQINQASAKAQLELKRAQGKIQVELKDKIFDEAVELVHRFMETPAYEAFLVKCIRKASDFANGEQMTVYINASDEALRLRLEAETGITLTVSTEDFIGGTRSVIRGRNILIDNSFKTQLRNEYDRFLFSGGDGIA